MTEEIQKIIQEQGINLPCFYLEKTDSTNTYAKQILRKGALQNLEQPFVVVANEQSQGRGRYDRSFLSLKDKGVFLSYVFSACDLGRLGAFACYSALAVKRVLKQLYGIESQIKWPNDVMVGGKKICGILPESVVVDGKRFVIIGIGVNINNTEDDFGDLNSRAVSVMQLTQKQTSTKKTSGYLSVELNKIYCEENFTALYVEYLDACTIVGKTVTIGDQEDNVCGKVVAVEEDFSLTVETAQTTVSVNWGEIISIK